VYNRIYEDEIGVSCEVYGRRRGIYRRFSLEDLKRRHHMGDLGVDRDDISVDLKEIVLEGVNRIHLARDGDQRQGLYIWWEVGSATVSFYRGYFCVMCTG
jgi:hypothetical protein